MSLFLAQIQGGRGQPILDGQFVKTILIQFKTPFGPTYAYKKIYVKMNERFVGMMF